MSVRLFNPTFLQSTYALTKVQEVLRLKKFSLEGIGSFHGAVQKAQQEVVARTILNSTMQKLGISMLPSSNNVNPGSKQTRRLSSKEMDERRQKGICLWCEEKFVSGHKCKKKQFNMLTVVDEDGLMEEDIEEDGGILPVNDSVAPQLSLHAINDTCGFQTMRIRGHGGARTLFLLLDSGSTHNFMDNKVVKQLGCILKAIPELKITVANGNDLLCNEVCRSF